MVTVEDGLQPQLVRDRGRSFSNPMASDEPGLASSRQPPCVSVSPALEPFGPVVVPVPAVLVSQWRQTIPRRDDPPRRYAAQARSSTGAAGLRRCRRNSRRPLALATVRPSNRLGQRIGPVRRGGRAFGSSVSATERRLRSLIVVNRCLLRDFLFW
jgi:hypothetical protein